MHLYIIFFPKPDYDWADVTAHLLRETPVDYTGVCANFQPSDDIKKFQPRSGKDYIFCVKRLSCYK